MTLDQFFATTAPMAIGSYDRWVLATSLVLLVALGSTTVALAAPAPLKVQASSPPGKLISDDFDNYVNGALKDWGVPGMAFAAFKVQSCCI